jgi:transposase InsO family protein
VTIDQTPASSSPLINAAKHSAARSTGEVRRGAPCPETLPTCLRRASDAAGRELLHHSDRGSQYTSEHCQRLMAENGIQCSLSRSGNVWGHAAMESFFSTLKTERTAGKVYRTRDAARADVFDYIERFYNPRRRHSTLGYLSPIAFEERQRLA